MSASKQTILSVEHLKKYFQTASGQLHAVDDVNFTLAKGETLGVVGESGCGKSTLGRTILRLHEPTDGKVIFDGKDVTACSKQEMKKLREDMQIIFQDPFASINPRMTVSQTIAEPLLIQGKYKPSDKEALNRHVRQVMDRVGLAQRLVNAYPHELDGGRRQRIGIGRALALEPKFIVCDEPVSALDVSIQAQIINLLKDMQEDMGLTYLFISHDLSIVRFISDDVAVMYLGQIVEMGSKKQIFDAPAHPYTQALLSAAPAFTRKEKREKKRILLEGDLPTPYNPPAGCRFAGRCPYAGAECRESVRVEEVEKGHKVMCLKAGKLS